MEGIVGLVLAGLALTGSPGPANVALAAAGAAFGARGGLGFMAGIVAGMVVVMAVIGFGVAGLVLALPGAVPVLSAAAAAYFLWLAWRIATARPLEEGTGQGRRPSFMDGVFLSLVNPKAYAAMAALFSGFALVSGAPGTDLVLKIAVLTGLILTVEFAWLALGAVLKRLFRNPRVSRALNLVFALLLLASLAFALRF